MLVAGWWFVAAVAIQLRLVCNLMDGLVAVEGGRRTPDGDLYNEFPDRVSDTLILAAAGYAAPACAWSVGLGWAAAVGALTTACVRMHGASLTGYHDFRGPMAKPQRMATMTAACLVLAVASWVGEPPPLIPYALGLVVVGTAVTAGRRLVGISRRLRAP